MDLAQCPSNYIIPIDAAYKEIKVLIMNIADIKASITQLPTNERANLVRWIISNFESTDEEKEFELAWMQEIRERIDEIKSGKVKMISAREYFHELYAGKVPAPR
jgi:putative addiction module component (TIGR02574 family)